MKKSYQAVYQKITPWRVDRFLTYELEGLTREDIQRLIKAGQLFVNNLAITRPSYKLRRGDRVKLRLDRSDNFVTAKPKISVLWEEGDFIVLEKPAGLPVYTTSKSSPGSLLELVLRQYPEVRAVGEVGRPGVIHRLDFGTSGLLIVARTKVGYEYFKKIFRTKKIEKEYQALVWGRVETKGSISAPLTKIGDRGQSKVRIDQEYGKSALTSYLPLRIYQLGGAFPAGKSVSSPPIFNRARDYSNRVDYFTQVRIILHTGRTHQIRVHFASLKHPVMGDLLYGKPFSQRLSDLLDRPFLHASRLAFQSPGGTWLEIESKLPADLTKVLASLRKTGKQEM